MDLPPRLEQKMSQLTRLTQESKLHARLAEDLAAESEQLAKELMGELDQFARVDEMSQRGRRPVDTHANSSRWPFR
jgi:hypothetical protein